jgi:hypothetical protein
MSPPRANLIPPPDAVRIDADRGTLRYWQLAPHVYATCVQGYMTKEMSDLLMEQGNPLYAHVRKLHGIHDWLDMTGYDSACRTDLTGWILRNRPKSVLHIGVTLPLVAMGVAVANLALGNLIQVHRNKLSLESALNQALASER